MTVRHLPITAGTCPANLEPARDLADFLLRWASFRPVASQVLRNPALSKDEAEVLGWMIALTDRLREDDIL